MKLYPWGPPPDLEEEVLRTAGRVAVVIGSVLVLFIGWMLLNVHMWPQEHLCTLPLSGSRNLEIYGDKEWEINARPLYYRIVQGDTVVMNMRFFMCSDTLRSADDFVVVEAEAGMLVGVLLASDTAQGVLVCDLRTRESDPGDVQGKCWTQRIAGARQLWQRMRAAYPALRDDTVTRSTWVRERTDCSLWRDTYPTTVLGIRIGVADRDDVVRALGPGCLLPPPDGDHGSIGYRSHDGMVTVRYGLGCDARVTSVQVTFAGCARGDTELLAATLPGTIVRNDLCVAPGLRGGMSAAQIRALLGPPGDETNGALCYDAQPGEKAGVQIAYRCILELSGDRLTRLHIEQDGC